MYGSATCGRLKKIRSQKPHSTETILPSKHKVVCECKAEKMLVPRSTRLRLLMHEVDCSVSQNVHIETRLNEVPESNFVTYNPKKEVKDILKC